MNTVNEVERNWNAITRFIKIIIGTVAVFITIAGVVLTYFGIDTYKNLEPKYENFITIVDESKKKYEKIKELEQLSEDAAIMSEIMLNIGDLRQDVRLDKKIEKLSNADLEDLREMSRNFRTSKRGFLNYMIEPENYNPEVVLAAIESFLQLLERADAGLKQEEKKHTIHSLLYVLKKTPKENWRVSIKVRKHLIDQAKKTKGVEYKKIIGQLKGIASNAYEKKHLRRNSAHILAALRESDDESLKVLRNTMNEGSSPWVRNQAAISLIQLDREEGWKYLSKSLSDDKAGSFQAALLLGQLNQEELKKLDFLRKLEIKTGQDTIAFIANKLEKGPQRKGNKYLEVYGKRLANELRYLQ
jgi:hypothetical protein